MGMVLAKLVRGHEAGADGVGEVLLVDGVALHVARPVHGRRLQPKRGRHTKTAEWVTKETPFTQRWKRSPGDREGLEQEAP